MILRKKTRIIPLLLALGLSLSACSTTSSYSDARHQVHHVRNPVKAADINVQLGLEFLKKGESAQAKSKLLLAKRLAPKDPAVWFGFGYFFENTGDPEQADYSYRKAIQLDPNHGNSHNNYGTFLCRHGKYQAAIKHFKLAIADPEYLDISGAYENAGIAALQLQNEEQAKHFFQKALEYNSSSELALVQLANIAYRKNSFALAKKYLTQWSYIAAPTPEGLWLRANVEKGLGHDEEYLKNMALLKEKFPKSDYLLKLNRPQLTYLQF